MTGEWSWLDKMMCKCFRVSSCFFVSIWLQFFFASNLCALDNEGTEFILGFLPNLGTSTIEVHLTGQTATTVTVEYPVNSPTNTQTVNVIPGAVSIVSIPSVAGTAWTQNAVSNNAVRLSASSEFVAYMINRQTSTSDAALGLPVDTFNKEFIVITNASTIEGLFAVVAAFDDTTVTITPSEALKGGRPADTPFTIMLDRGEGYLGQEGGTSTAGLTGTIITADKPIGVTNGNKCSNKPAGACDHTFEVAHPVQTWGTQILAANLPNRSVGAAYRVVASEDGTDVTMDGNPLGTINRGQFIDIAQDPDDFVIEADAPIFAIQIQPGKNGADPGEVGDPAIGNLLPPDQFRSSYTFSTVGGGQFAENFLVLVANNSDLATITLDGTPVGSGQFSQIGASSFSVARLPLADGVHSTASTKPHSITVLGYGGSDSYQYPGGAELNLINSAGDTNDPLCTLNEMDGPPPTAQVTGTDNRPSEDTNSNSILDPGEDLNGNGEIDIDSGIFAVELLSGSTNLQINVPSFTPGEESVSATVSLQDTNASGTGTVRVTDGVGNTCEAMIALNDDTTPPDAPVVTVPAAGAVISDTTPTISGTAEANSTVEVFIDDSSIGSTNAGSAGSWSITPAAELAEGQHAVNARATDMAMNTGSQSADVIFVVDTSGPDAPVVTSPAEGAFVKDSMPAISGTSEANSTVEVFVDEESVGTTVADSEGNWSLTLTVALIDGVHSVNASATDSAMNAGGKGASLSFTVDTVPPQQPSVDIPSEEIDLVGLRTLEGQAEAGTVIEVIVDSVSVGTLTVGESGSWSFDLPQALASGSRNVEVTATDRAGNVSVIARINLSIPQCAQIDLTPTKDIIEGHVRTLRDLRKRAARLNAKLAKRSGSQPCQERNDRQVARYKSVTLKMGRKLLKSGIPNEQSVCEPVPSNCQARDTDSLQKMMKRQARRLRFFGTFLSLGGRCAANTSIAKSVRKTARGKLKSLRQELAQLDNPLLECT